MIVEARGPVVVSTPARKGTAPHSVSRVTSGSLVICSVVRVEPSVFVCVCTTSVPLLTVTVSLNWPSSSLTFTCAAVAVLRRMSESATVLNPCSEMVTV